LFRRHPDLLLAATYLLITLIWIHLLPPSARLDRDEGFNIMKAALVEDGYRLYEQIWSDQPPLFTHMLVVWRQMFGPGDAAARSLVAILVSLGLASAGRIATWLGQSPRAGVPAILLLIAARSFPKLSMAVMIGLPAISVALASVWLMIASAHGRLRRPTLLLCGALFACSMQVKLFTVILAPMVLCVCAMTCTRAATALPRRWVVVVDTLLLMTGFTIATLLLAPLGEPGWRQQLLQPHLKTARPTDDTIYDSLRSVVMRFLEDAPLMLACLSTMLLAGRDAVRRATPMLLWIATSVVVLSQANPLWGHHRVMFSIPAAVMTAVAATAILRRGTSPPLAPASNRVSSRRIVSVALAIALGYGLASLLYSAATLGRGREGTMDAEVLGRLTALQPRTKWVLSDDPHLVHAAGMRVPPETAVLSLKRLQRDLTEEQLSEVISRYQPKLVLLARHEWDAEFPGAINRLTADYMLVLTKRQGRVVLFELLPE